MTEGGGKLSVSNLHVTVAGKEILKGVTLDVKKGELIAIMGPNGSGKSTLAYALAGHPRYTVTAGTASMDGKDLLSLTPDARARAGLFLGFQYPVEVSGVSLSKFLWTAYTQKHVAEEIDIDAYQSRLDGNMSQLGVDNGFLKRSLNEGFSGGEKKRIEVLQMATLEPHFSILDEPDSGLDIDAVKVVGESIAKQRRPDLGIIVITHYQRILKYINPDRVYVLVDGVVAKEGGRSLAEELESKGYDWIKAAGA
ncbi:MAG: Fe-S cluster assembly ATPase SufC [Candidatus Thermoplasmatota archaeon]|jgi:Fe-S cluster assembly ATP-binding protein|nr:Fe-S cluster assembly ATPase SufC [Candidatus Thermoplasmatota archaeon]